MDVIKTLLVIGMILYMIQRMRYCALGIQNIDTREHMWIRSLELRKRVIGSVFVYLSLEGVAVEARHMP